MEPILGWIDLGDNTNLLYFPTAIIERYLTHELVAEFVDRGCENQPRYPDSHFSAYSNLVFLDFDLLPASPSV